MVRRGLSRPWVTAGLSPRHASRAVSAPLACVGRAGIHCRAGTGLPGPARSCSRTSVTPRTTSASSSPSLYLPSAPLSWPSSAPRPQVKGPVPRMPRNTRVARAPPRKPPVETPPCLIPLPRAIHLESSARWTDPEHGRMFRGQINARRRVSDGVDAKAYSESIACRACSVPLCSAPTLAPSVYPLPRAV